MDMLKTKRKDKADEKYAGFTANRPYINIKPYSARRGTEIGYVKLEGCRSKTRIAGIKPMTLRFLYSLMLLDE